MVVLQNELHRIASITVKLQIKVIDINIMVAEKQQYLK